MAIGDELVEGASPSGLIIMHDGDPVWTPSSPASTMPEARRLFLRVVAYLVFAEQLAVPARYLLGGEPLFRAFLWLRPLVEVGWVVPERRAGVGSLEELARTRRLGEVAVIRAAALDDFVGASRSFRFEQLSEHYRDVLTADLAKGGAFRRTVVGAQRGKHVAALDAAVDWHLEHGDGTPERFAEAVAVHARSLRKQALKWAMARYYVTPTAFDHVNTRELPRDARDLLVEGDAFPKSLDYYAEAAPVQDLSGRLEMQLPLVPVELFHREYCEALAEVRSQFPEARRVFGTIREASQMEDAGRTVAARFADELARQMAERKPEVSQSFSLKASLLSGAAASPLAFAEPGVSLPLGLAVSVASGIAVPKITRRREAAEDKENRPWVLAIDEMDRRVRASRPGLS